MRPLKGVVWLLFAAISYLIVAEAVSPWVKLPSAGNILFTLVFVLFSVMHCAALEGAKRTAIFFFASAIVTYAMEEIGVRTGWIFGAYHYSDLLGPKLGHVPVLIPLGWFMMIYPSWMVARTLMQGLNTRSELSIVLQAAIAAVTMTAWDVVMDPAMAAGRNWVWENGGAYYGVPRHNYLGWLMTTFLVYLIAGFVWKTTDRSYAKQRWFPLLPVIVYALFAARYVAYNRFVALQMVAIFTMGLPSLLALTRALLAPELEAERPVLL
jgi:putative membrane protein